MNIGTQLIISYIELDKYACWLYLYLEIQQNDFPIEEEHINVLCTQKGHHFVLNMTVYLAQINLIFSFWFPAHTPLQPSTHLVRMHNWTMSLAFTFWMYTSSVAMRDYIADDRGKLNYVRSITLWKYRLWLRTSLPRKLNYISATFLCHVFYFLRPETGY